MATENERKDYLSEEEQNSLKEIIKNEGIAGVKQHLDEWKTIPLNVAVTGNSGTGKSSFINAIRNLTADDDGAAKVGVVETTTERKPFCDPNNKNLTFWDLPGVGTPHFEQKTYLKDVSFHTYDFFLIICNKRFTENDVWLAQQIHAQGKKYYFIRTHIDVELANDKRSHPSTYKERNVIKIIYDDCQENLKSCTLAHEDNIFLIDNYDTKIYDFGTLCTRLITDASELKREAITLSLSVLATEVIEQKRKILNKRIWKISIISALGGATPIPGVVLVNDGTILLKEALFYREQLHLNDDYLAKQAETLKLPLEIFKKTIGLINTAIPTVTSIGKTCHVYAVSEGVENVAIFEIPILGSIISGSSYGATVYCLRSLLDTMVKDALKIQEEFAKRLI